MIYLERTFDVERINQIINDPSISDLLCDDNSIGAQITDCDSQIWIGVFDDNGMQGAFLIIPQNSVTVDVHTCLLPILHGKQAVEAGKLLRDMLFQHFKKIVTSVPVNNRRAAIFAASMGFITEGINRKSFLKNNILLDQKVMGLTHEEYVCQSQQ